MRKHFLLPALLVSTALQAQISFNFGDLAGKKNITLIAADKSTTELTGLKFKKSNTVISRFTFYIKPEQALPSFSPIVVHYGELNPTRGMNINLVRLVQDGEYLKGILKKGFTGYSTHSDAEPFPGKKSPEPVKQSDGKYTLTFTESLAPGSYAFVSEERAWAFSVPATN